MRGEEKIAGDSEKDFLDLKKVHEDLRLPLPRFPP